MNTQEIVSIGACLLFFFATSLGLSFFSSYFLSVDGYSFRFPLFYFAMHHFVHFALSAFGIWYLKKGVLHEEVIESPLPYIMREKIGSPLEALHKESRLARPVEPSKTRIDSILYAIYQFLNDIGAFNVWIVVCCFIGSIDSGFSGHALTRISLPFYTMLKSTTPVFILFARFVFQLESPSIALVVIISMIASGISLAAKSNTVVFNIKYGLMILGACVMAGFRWGFLEYFIKHSTKKNNSILHSLSVLSLLSGVFLSIGFLVLEGLPDFVSFERFSSASGTFLCLLLIMGTAVVGFLGCLAEFQVISKTNVMVSSVVMIIKEIAILCISVYRKTLVLSLLNIAGLCISITGIILFTFRSVLFSSVPAQSTASQEEPAALDTDVEKPILSAEESPIAMRA